jgi:hypothetical protein
MATSYLYQLISNAWLTFSLIFTTYEQLRTLYITKTIDIGKNSAKAGYLHANAGKWNLIRDNIGLYKPNIRIISFALDINAHF